MEFFFPFTFFRGCVLIVCRFLPLKVVCILYFKKKYPAFFALLCRPLNELLYLLGVTE